MEAVDAILGDFRAWLLEARDATSIIHASADDRPGFDVAGVLQHFIALRHEVHLQTRASRQQYEQNAQTIAMLQESTGAEAGDDAHVEIARPLLKTLIDAHDALALAEKQVRKLLETSPAAGTNAGAEAPPHIRLKIPHWARWIGLDASIESQLAPLYAWQQARRHAAEAGPDRQRQSLESLLAGYRMSMQRIARALEQHGVESLPCVGQAFDPEIMEVADVVHEAGRTKTEVIEEIRTGYRWRGQLFRCAQVRVARGHGQ
jgi:molecular chaperone GrpE